MLNALSSTEKSESDDHARNATPKMPSAVAFSRIARTARSRESRDVLGKVRWSSRTKNEPEFAWPAVLRTASERKSNGTNESSAKYAIIAARCVPRSAKNLRAIARISSSMLRRMDAAQALADLTEISSQVVHVAIVDGDGEVLATTITDAGRAERFVQGVTTLLEEADGLRQSRGLPGLSQLEAATLEGSVFVVRRESDAGPF